MMSTVQQALVHAKIILETLQDAGKVRCPGVIQELDDAIVASQAPKKVSRWQRWFRVE